MVFSINEQAAAKIWSDFSGRPALKIKRFLTGSCNYVFKVVDDRGEHILRVAEPANRGHLAGSLYWLDKLAPLGLAIPQIEFSGIDQNPPFVALNYIKGNDLGHVIGKLSEDQKRAIALRVAEAQSQVSGLEPAAGYGHLTSYADPSALPTWEAVVRRHIQRSRTRLLANGIFSPNYADRVEAQASSFSEYFASVLPIAFLDDATTKNVLIHDGEFQGIVDLDWLCFGDSLYAPALTAMSLRASGNSLSYIDYWLGTLELSPEQKRAFRYYNLVFCLDFMSEIGMRFNKDQASPISQAEISTLTDQFESLCP